MTQTIDPAAVVPPTPQRRIKLASVRGVRREMAAVYADCRQGRMDVLIGSKLTQMLTCIAKVLEASDLERRIGVLEGNANDPQPEQTLTTTLRLRPPTTGQQHAT
jgi:hypothetical protein